MWSLVALFPNINNTIRTQRQLESTLSSSSIEDDCLDTFMKRAPSTVKADKSSSQTFPVLPITYSSILAG